MGNDEKLIWAYLDGSLSARQQTKVAHRLSSDPAFLKLYKAQQQLHKGLQEVMPEQAPNFILSNVMVSLRNETIYQAKTTNFVGLKYFAIAFGFVNLILIVYGLTSTAPTTTGNGFSNTFSEFFKPLTNLELVNSFSAQGQPYLIYGVTISLLVLLFWGDLMLSKVRTVKSR